MSAQAPRARRSPRPRELGALPLELSRAGDLTLLTFEDVDVVLTDRSRVQLERLLHGLEPGDELSETLDGEVRV